MQPIRIDSLATPTGRIYLVTGYQDELLAVDWEDCAQRLATMLRLYHGYDSLPSIRVARAIPACEALRAYFDGQVDALGSLKVRLPGTSFRQRVWTALRKVPAGQTVSYGQLAALIGRPSAARAVGHANAQNPLPIVVPCHRVVGADGSLTGFGGGLDRKRWLLAHEQRAARHAPMPPARERDRMAPGRS